MHTCGAISWRLHNTAAGLGEGKTAHLQYVHTLARTLLPGFLDAVGCTAAQAVFHLQAFVVHSFNRPQSSHVVVDAQGLARSKCNHPQVWPKHCALCLADKLGQLRVGAATKHNLEHRHP